MAPEKSLARKLKNNVSTTDKMGPDSILGQHINENEFLLHSKKAQKHGFPMTVSDIRNLAYNSAVSLQINSKFKREKGVIY